MEHQVDKAEKRLQHEDRILGAMELCKKNRIGVEANAKNDWKEVR